MELIRYDGAPNQVIQEEKSIEKSAINPVQVELVDNETDVDMEQSQILNNLNIYEDGYTMKQLKEIDEPKTFFTDLPQT